MKISMNTTSLSYFEALASKTRLEIIRLLSEKDMNIKELANALGISSSIMTKHIRKLENAKIITTNTICKDGSRYKVCTLLNTITEIQPTFKINRGAEPETCYEISIPVGQFTDLFAIPPCGIANEEQMIGDLDDPIRMLAPDRFSAELIWIGEGFIEYTIPNYLREKQTLTALEISGEFGSETAGYNDDWPSHITVKLNEKNICSFTTPGDIGGRRGSLTPDWWRNNQYGILIIIRINKRGVFVNGEKKSNVTISDLNAHCDRWKLRFEVNAPSQDGGGLTIFGKKFGNYAQDLLFQEYYE